MTAFSLDPEGLDRVAVADTDAALAGVISEQPVDRRTHPSGELGDAFVPAEQAGPEHVHEPQGAPPGDVARSHTLEVGAEASLGELRRGRHDGCVEVGGDDA